MGGVEVFQLLATVLLVPFLVYSTGIDSFRTRVHHSYCKPPLTPQFSRSVLNKKSSVKKKTSRSVLWLIYCPVEHKFVRTFFPSFQYGYMSTMSLKYLTCVLVLYLDDLHLFHFNPNGILVKYCVLEVKCRCLGCC